MCYYATAALRAVEEVMYVPTSLRTAPPHSEALGASRRQVVFSLIFCSSRLLIYLPAMQERRITLQS